MQHYTVWQPGSKVINSPEAGTIISAKDSFEARRICAAAWRVSVTDVCARRVDR